MVFFEKRCRAYKTKSTGTPEEKKPHLSEAYATAMTTMTTPDAVPPV